jgi:hypothetical protein
VKQVTAILLIAILFFNWYGYRIITSYLQKHADGQLVTKLDNHIYEESELIELRVELNVPYQNNQTEFERHYGEIEINGKFYTYVKRKIENGFLVVKCIPNSQKDKIKAASNDFLKMAIGLDQDHQTHKQSNHSISIKNFLSDYDNHVCSWNIAFLNESHQHYFLTSASSLYTTYQLPMLHPPEGGSCLLVNSQFISV